MWHSVSGMGAHELFEALAYFIGARVYWHVVKGVAQPAPADRLLLLGMTIFGAFLGSKLLHIAEHLPFLVQQNSWPLWLGGKSVLGGLLGGLLGGELGKRVIGWRTPTGDPWVPALAVGMMVGRVGCQLSGVWDQTYGIPTTLPWAWDYGDHIGRHPTGLYEIGLIALALFLTKQPWLTRKPGARFAAYLWLYCAIRLGLEFLKPPFGLAAAGTLPVTLYAGLTAIQWTALAGMAGLTLLLSARLRGAPEPEEHGKK